MKYSSIFVSAALCIPLLAIGQVDQLSSVAGNGPKEERAAVQKVLQDYLRVTDERSREAIARSFHPTAMLNSVTSSGVLRAMTQDEWWDRVSRIPTDTPPRKSRVSLIEVSQSAAVARIDIVDGRGNNSSDMFTLQKTAAGWRITNKVLSAPL